MLLTALISPLPNSIGAANAVEDPARPTPVERAQAVARRWESAMGQANKACETSADPACHTTRYYLGLVQQDLFGNWELLKIWGAKGSARGGHQCMPVADRPSGLAALDALARRRAARGYQQTPWLVGAQLDFAHSQAARHGVPRG
jgi:hypothetical protein